MTDMRAHSPTDIIIVLEAQGEAIRRLDRRLRIQVLIIGALIGFAISHILGLL